MTDWTFSKDCHDFNPRPSCEGRPGSADTDADKVHFNPRPSCEGRLHDLSDRRFGRISIHAPRVRGDQTRGSMGHTHRDFNPRPSCEGRPGYSASKDRARNFNPRPSCEGRLGCSYVINSELQFQSTPLV